MNNNIYWSGHFWSTNLNTLKTFSRHLNGKKKKTVSCNRFIYWGSNTAGAPLPTAEAQGKRLFSPVWTEVLQPCIHVHLPNRVLQFYLASPANPKLCMMVTLSHLCYLHYPHWKGFPITIFITHVSKCIPGNFAACTSHDHDLILKSNSSLADKS